MKIGEANPSRHTRNPSWHFPPTGGGVEVIQESATTNFRESPLDKFVREILQNSTDAHDHNLGPVEVTFREVQLSVGVVRREHALVEHTRAALLAASEENRPKAGGTVPESWRNVKGQRTIRCLNIADQQHYRVGRETIGTLSSPSQGRLGRTRQPQGGDRGMGKNAVFNVSAAKTAFYYTCFQEGRGRNRHRVEKWMGKSVLTAHVIDGETRQHIGFFRHPDGRAVEGSAIPKQFRMKTSPGQLSIPATGTTITVLGFEPQNVEIGPRKSPSQPRPTSFCAIHRGQLVVTWSWTYKGEETRIDRNTLKNIFAKHDREPQTR